MPADTLTLAIIVAPFVIFMAGLGWVAWRTERKR